MIFPKTVWHLWSVCLAAPTHSFCLRNKFLRPRHVSRPSLSFLPTSRFLSVRAHYSFPIQEFYDSLFLNVRIVPASTILGFFFPLHFSGNSTIYFRFSNLPYSDSRYSAHTHLISRDFLSGDIEQKPKTTTPLRYVLST